MAREIDERVVEMRFDNKQFEANTKQTMNSLEKLKASLNMDSAVESFNKLDHSMDNLDLKGISAGVAALQERFSTLGIASMRVIQNMTDSLMNLATKGLSSVSDMIVSGGIKRAMNIENAHFQLQSLLKDEVEVTKIMDAASTSVDGTAYSYDVAAKAASMFAASGIKSGESMEAALNSIANVTAAVNGDYESMAMIFTQVSGQGRLMGDQLLQLSTRGMNAAATIANYFKEVRGEADITEADIRDMVSRGEIDFMTFVNAMNHAYEGAAKRANETFTGAFSNIKSAFARIGAGFVSPLVAQNSEVVNLFNAIRVKVNEVKKALVFDEALGNVNALSKQFSDAVLNMAKSLSVFIKEIDITAPMRLFTYNVEILKNVFKAVYKVIAPVGQAFKNVFLTTALSDAQEFAERLNGIISRLHISGETAENIRDLFQGLFDVLKLALDVFTEVGISILDVITSLFNIEKPLIDVNGGFIGLLGSVGRLISKFVDWVRTSPLIIGAFEAIGDVVTGLFEIFAGIVREITGFIRSIKELSVTNKIIKFLIKTFEPFEDKIIPYLQKGITAIGKFGKKLSELSANPIKRLLGAAQKYIEQFKESLVFTKITDSLRNLIENIIKAAGKFVEWAKETNLVERVQARIAKVIKVVAEQIRKLIIRVANFIIKVKDLAVTYDIVGKVKNAFSSLASATTPQLKKVIKYVIEFVKLLKNLSIKDVANFFGALKDKVIDFKNSLNFKKIFSNIYKLSKTVVNVIFEIIKAVGKLLEKINIDKLTAGIKNGVDIIKSIFTTLLKVIQSIAKAFKDTFLSGVSNDLVKITDVIKNLFSKLAISDKAFKSIYDIFKGIFDVAKLLFDILVKLASAITDIVSALFDVGEPTQSITDGFLGLLGTIGRLLSGFTEWIRSSSLVNGAFDTIIGLAKTLASFIGNLIDRIIGLTTSFHALVSYRVILGNLFDVFKAIADFVIPYLKKATDYLFGFGKGISSTSSIAQKFTNIIVKVTGIIADNIDEVLDIVETAIKVVTNIIEALVSIIKPIGKAFKDAFLTTLIDDTSKFAEKIDDITSRLKISGKTAENLYDIFKGLFDVLKLVIDAALKVIVTIADIVTSVFKVEKPIKGLDKSFLDLLGAIGKLLSKFTEWVRTSPMIESAFNAVVSVLKALLKIIVSVVNAVSSLVLFIGDLPFVKALIRDISKLLSGLASSVVPLIDRLVDGIGNLTNKLMRLPLDAVKKFFTALSDKLSEFRAVIRSLDLGTPIDWINKLIDAVKRLVSSIGGKKDTSSAITNAESFSDKLKKVFNFETVINYVNKFKEALSQLLTFISDKIGPALQNFSLGNMVASGVGVGLMYTLINMSQAFDKIAGSFNTFPKILSKVGDALVAYQKQAQADVILKSAKAIFVLAGALVLLSFVDSDKVMAATTALSMISTVLMAGAYGILKAMNDIKSINTVLLQVGKAMNNFAMGIKYKAMGAAFKDMAAAIVIILIAIVGIGKIYQKDPKAVEDGVTIVGLVAAAMTAIITIIGILGKKINSAVSAFMRTTAGILAIAASLELCVIAISHLFKIKLPDDYKSKLAIFAGILTGLTTVTIALNRTAIVSAGSIKVAPLIATVISAAAVIKELDVLFKMKLPKDYGAKLAILSGIFIGLAGLTTVIGLAAKAAGGAIKGAPVILALTAFIGTVTLSLSVLSLPIFKGNKLLAAATSLGLVLLALAEALNSAGKMVQTKSYTVVLAMALEIGAITTALGVLSLLTWDRLLKSSVALGAVLLALAKDFEAIGKISHKIKYKVIATMVAETIALTASLTILSSIPWDRLLSATISLSAVLLSFAGSMRIISKAQGMNIKDVYNFVAMTAALLPIVSALTTLAKEDWKGMAASGVALTGTIIAFGQAFKAVSTATQAISPAKILSFVGLTAALAPIAATLSILAKEDWKGIGAAGLAITSAVIAFSQVFKAIGNSTQVVNLSSIATFLAMTSALIPIVLAISSLADNDWKSLGAAGVSLTGVILAFTRVFKALSNSVVGFRIGALAVFLAATIAIIPITDAISNMSKGNDWKAMLSAAGSLSAVLAAISAALKICSAIGVTAHAAISSLVAIDIFLANFTAILFAMGKIFNTPAAQSILSGGVNVFTKIGEAIGGFIGGILGGAMGAIASGFAATMIMLGTGLSGFMTKATPFFAGLNRIDPNSAKSASIIANTISVLTANSVTNGISNIFTLGQSSFTKLGTQLSSFGNSMSKYADSISNIDNSTVAASEAVVKIIKSMSDVGGMIKKLAAFGSSGGVILTNFVEQLADLAPNIKNYSDIVSGNGGISAESVLASASAAEIMFDLANKLPNTGDLATKFFGDHSLASFGDELIKFGTGFSSYASKVTNIKPDVIVASASAAASLAELANKLPATGALASKIFGEHSLASFGEELTKFGTSFVQYAVKVTGIKADVITASIAAATSLAIFATKIPATGGLINLFTGKATLGDFGKQLAVFGKSFAEYANSVTNIKYNEISKVTKSMDQLFKMAAAAEKASANGLTLFVTELSKVGMEGIDKFIESFNGADIRVKDTINSLFTSVTTVMSNRQTEFENIGKGSLDNFIKGLEKGRKDAILAAQAIAVRITDGIEDALKSVNTQGENIAKLFLDGMKTQYNNAVSIGNELANKFISGLSVKENSLSNIGSRAAISYFQGVKNKYSEARNVGNTLGAKVVEGITRSITSLLAQGQEVADGYIDGVKSRFQDALNAGKDLANYVSNGLKSIISPTYGKSVFYTHGVNIAQGLIDGMKSKQREVENTAKNLANAASNAIATAAKIKSPSRVTMKQGSYLAEGLIIGMLSKVSAVSNAARTLTDAAINDTNDALANMSEVFTSETDLDPVIRPIVDLSNVTMSAQMINDLFNEAISITASNARGISKSINGSQINESSNIQNDKDSSKNGNTYIFEQHNNSPKALSRIDIYRQTRNQFSQFSKVVSAQ